MQQLIIPFAGDRLAIITGTGSADAQLVHELLQHFPDALVVRYQVRKLTNYRYYIRKFFRIGIISSIHIKVLAAYLSAKRSFATSNTQLPMPNYTIHDCDDESELQAITKDRTYVLITQALRLRDHFFKQRQVLQIVGGKYPDYCGDAALFWAWAQRRKEDYFYSIILRNKYFLHSALVRSCAVALTEKETIHTLRKKGMAAVTKELPAILSSAETWQTQPQHYSPAFLNSPTLLIYLLVTHFHRTLKKIPAYAKR